MRHLEGEYIAPNYDGQDVLGLGPQPILYSSPGPFYDSTLALWRLRLPYYISSVPEGRLITILRLPTIIDSTKDEEKRTAYDLQGECCLYLGTEDYYIMYLSRFIQNK